MYEKTSEINELHNKFSTTDYPVCEYLHDSMGMLGFDLWVSIVEEVAEKKGGFDIVEFMEKHPMIPDLSDVFFELEDVGLCQIHIHAVIGTAYVYFFDVIRSLHTIKTHDLIGYVNDNVN